MAYGGGRRLLGPLVVVNAVVCMILVGLFRMVSRQIHRRQPEPSMYVYPSLFYGFSYPQTSSNKGVCMLRVNRFGWKSVDNIPSGVWFNRRSDVRMLTRFGVRSSSLMDESHSRRCYNFSYLFLRTNSPRLRVLPLPLYRLHHSFISLRYVTNSKSDIALFASKSQWGDAGANAW